MVTNINIPQGYKQTELGIIPEDWEVVTLGGTAQNCSYGTGAESSSYNGGPKYIRITDIDDVTRLFVPTPLSSPAFYREIHIVQDNDILFARTGASVGKSYIYNSQDGVLVFAGFLMRFNIINNSAKFVFYNTLSKRYNDWVLSESARTGQPGLNIKQLSSYKLPIPPIAEQRAIASALSDVDSLIAALDKKIAKKRLLKQGAMQQLLTGKKRLPGFTDEWVEKKLGKMSHIKTGSRNGDQAVENGKYPFFVRSQKVYAIDTYSFDGEAILVPGEGGIGNIFHYINGKFDFHQRVYKISDFADEVCGKFIYFYMSRYFGDYALSLTVKATVDSLRLPTFEEFVICMPSDIEEQQAIATILSDMDKEIADLEAQRDKYRLLKSGMMQKLLTGQIRLKRE